MSLHIKICHDVWGTWSVHGLSSVPVSNLPSLSASIDYARTAMRRRPRSNCMSTGCTSWLISNAGGQRRSSLLKGVGAAQSLPNPTSDDQRCGGDWSLG
jgi:hypothetical protein